MVEKIPSPVEPHIPEKPQPLVIPPPEPLTIELIKMILWLK